MIFVTVGTGRFESLVQEVDRLAKEGVIKEKVIVQLGRGSYVPKHCSWFRFEPSLEAYFKKARLVISHGGSTIFELLHLKKPLIVVPNRDRNDLHQIEFASFLAKETSSFIYCDKSSLLESCLKKVNTFKFLHYKSPKGYIPQEIIKFLAN